MDFFSAKNKRIGLLLFSIFVIVFSVVLIYISVNSKNKTGQSNQTTNQTEIYKGSSPAPVFQNWKESNNAFINKAVLNDQSTFYAFKTGYTPQELNNIATILKVSPESENDSYAAYSKYSSDSASLLIFQKADGNLKYLSTEGIKLGSAQDINDQILKFVKSLGIYDSSVKITASYKRKSIPGVTYYELHRDWKEIGYPIFNPIGLLNLPENQLLKDLSFNTRDEHYKDTDIYLSSDQNDAYARKTDFNSMTIAVDQNTNTILSIDSNIQPLTLNTNIIAKQNLITLDEAIAKLKHGEQQLFLTVPAGDGAVDFTKVYPDQKAVGKDAVIEESIIAYLEYPGSDKTLEPYYIFRGYSNLDSGYRVRFIATVPANKTANVQGAFIAQAPGIGGQQQGTLTFPEGDSETATPVPTIPKTVTIIPTKINPSPKISPKATQTKTSSCNEISSNKVAEINIAGNTFILAQGGYGFNDVTYSWFWIKNGTNSDELKNANIINSILANFKKIIGTFDYTKFVSDTLQIREIDGMLSDLEAMDDACELRVTGASPSLFIYGKENSNFMVKINHNIFYSDPAIQKGWNVTIGKNNLFVNNVQRNYLYYEYEAVPFVQPEKGWVIERKNLYPFVKRISSQLKLNNAEKSRLTFELQHAALGIHTDYIFVGLIPQSIIDAKLPLEISPKVEATYRYHFYLKGMNNRTAVESMVLEPIKRTEPMIVEFGAVNAP